MPDCEEFCYSFDCEISHVNLRGQSRNIVIHCSIGLDFQCYLLKFFRICYLIFLCVDVHHLRYFSFLCYFFDVFILQCFSFSMFLSFSVSHFRCFYPSVFLIFDVFLFAVFHFGVFLSLFSFTDNLSLNRSFSNKKV